MNYIAHVRNIEDKQLLKEHLQNVSLIASRNASKLGLSKSAELIGLFHDLGKYSEAFQNYIGSATGIIDQDADEYVDSTGLKGKIDHSSAGAQMVWSQSQNKNGQNKIIAQILSLCVASHHSGLIDCVSPDGKDVFLKRMSKSEEITYLEEVKNRVETDIHEKITNLIDAGSINSEILVFLKNIAKNENSQYSIKTQFSYGLIIRMLYSCLIDADRMDTADFENPKQAKNRQSGKYYDWDVLINRLETKISKFEQKPDRNEVDDIRKIVSDACFNRGTDDTGVFTLTVPTGGGKTLASLRFALQHAKKHNLDRIIYVIPFTSIIDQNARVVREILETEKQDSGRIVLEHHSNLLPEVQNSRNKILSENWDAPVVYTTSVQLLETLFSGGTRSVRRMHQLANAIIIFDEIQTLPVKTVHLFCNAINFLTKYCHSSVVLCTATQPLLNHVEEEKGRISFDASNEIMPDVEKLYNDLKRVDVENIIKPEGWSNKEIANLAKKQVEESASCLVIVNTKKNAQAVFQECIEFFEIPVYHLSTSMCPAHRMKKLTEIRQKLEVQEPLICVSTQLIEAGVDVDFGSVIRFVAGIDSIAQAAGRCNRNGKRKIGKVFIVNPQEETIESLVDIKLGKEQTERILREMANPESGMPKELIHPLTMERYFKYYFYNRASEMVFPVDVGHDDNLLNLLSINAKAVSEYKRIHNDKEPEIYFRQAFKTAGDKFKAIDAPTQGIIVPFEEGEAVISELFSQFAVEKQFVLLKKAQRFTVNVFPNVLQKLRDAKAIKEVPEIGVLVLSDPRYYHPEFGLSTEIVTSYKSLIS